MPDVSEPTVRLHVRVHVDHTDDGYDTGIPLAEWNALSDEERSAVYNGAWDAAAQHDDGGIWPATEGAKS